MNAIHLKSPDLKVLKELKRLLRPDQVSIGDVHRLNYGRDACSKSTLWIRNKRVPYPPDAVVWPEKTEEVASLLRFASEHRVPVIPFGGGSGVCGGTWALQGGIAVDLKRMQQIKQVDSRKMQVVAQAGVVGEVLERELQRRGFSLGHFPSSIYSATLGGYLACRSAGQFSSLYGKIEDMVEGLEVILADGSILPLSRVSDHPGRLDLIEMFLGSEGTLGFMTEAKLRIHPLPEHQTFLSFSYKNLELAMAAIRNVMQRDLKPFLVRLYDPLDTKLFLSHGDSHSTLKEMVGKVTKPLFTWVKDMTLKSALKNSRWLKRAVDLWSGGSLLVLGFHGDKDWVASQELYATELCQAAGGKSTGPEPGRYWQEHRYSVSYRMSPLFDEGYFADTMEIATYWSNLPNLYQQVREALSEDALVFAHFSHAYPEGCSIYFTFLGYEEGEEAAVRKYDRIWHRALSACVRAGGTVSHHHGVGVLKAPFMKAEWGDSMEWLRALKEKLDPQGILNPGKLGLSEVSSTETDAEGVEHA